SPGSSTSICAPAVNTGRDAPPGAASSKERIVSASKRMAVTCSSIRPSEVTGTEVPVRLVSRFIILRPRPLAYSLLLSPWFLHTHRASLSPLAQRCRLRGHRVHIRGDRQNQA